MFAVENQKGVEKGRLFPTRYDLHAGPRGIYNALVKANKDLNRRVDADTDLLVKLADCACDHLQAALPEVEAIKARGAKAHKLAKILTRRVADRYQLSVAA